MINDVDQIPDIASLRQHLDALDAELVSLLARRMALIHRAAQIKARDGLPARIDARVEEVAANARRNAITAGLDPELAEAIWRRLIEHAISHEETFLKEARP